VIEISQRVFGLGCLAGALALTFFYPLGRKTGSHLISNLLIILLSVGAAYNLIPNTLIESDLTVILLGAAVGAAAVFVRSILRWLRYFQGAVHRRTSPYYWYSRAFSRRRRRW
jgi:uncharacterized oligopeptide transporter (OPT) family protein